MGGSKLLVLRYAAGNAQRPQPVCPAISRFSELTVSCGRAGVKGSRVRIPPSRRPAFPVLGKRAGDGPVVRRVLRGGEQRPVQPDALASYLLRDPIGVSTTTSNSTISLAVAADAFSGDDADDAAACLAEAVAGGDVIEVFQSRTPTTDEAADLDLPAGVPVLAAESTVTNPQGTPVAYSSITHHEPMSHLVRRR